jgi:phospholipid-transporting ATPase
MIVLCTSENLGAAYIETSNIDGETSLKLKASVRNGDSSGLPLFNTPSSIRQSGFTIQCDQPNSIIDQFNGTLLLNNKEIYVDSASLLLRGSTLRNTKWSWMLPTVSSVTTSCASAGAWPKPLATTIC